MLLNFPRFYATSPRPTKSHKVKFQELARLSPPVGTLRFRQKEKLSRLGKTKSFSTLGVSNQYHIANVLDHIMIDKHQPNKIY